MTPESLLSLPLESKTRPTCRAIYGHFRHLNVQKDLYWRHSINIVHFIEKKSNEWSVNKVDEQCREDLFFTRFPKVFQSGTYICEIQSHPATQAD